MANRMASWRQVGDKLEVRWPKVAKTYEKTIGTRGPLELGGQRVGGKLEVRWPKVAKELGQVGPKLGS